MGRRLQCSDGQAPLPFSLLWSAIAYVRGPCSSIGHFQRAPSSLDLIRVESNIITVFVMT